MALEKHRIGPVFTCRENIRDSGRRRRDQLIENKDIREVKLWILVLSKSCTNIGENDQVFCQWELPKSGIPKVYGLRNTKKPVDGPGISRRARELTRRELVDISGKVRSAYRLSEKSQQKKRQLFETKYVEEYLAIDIN